MITTADGRTLTAEDFRRIPGFRKYRVSRDGDVMNVRTGKLLQESQHRTGAFYYTLWKDDGGSTCRNYAGLVQAAWETNEAVPDGAASDFKETK